MGQRKSACGALLQLPVLLTLLLWRRVQLCAADHCSWKGSGLSWEPRSRAVEQVRLRCTEGSLEWLYPTRALRVILAPNLASAPHTTVCIKPMAGFTGANIYVERGGSLHLLVSEVDKARLQTVHCFSSDHPQLVALFLQASPQRDISRRTAGFQYELLSNSSASPSFQITLVEAMCRPCDNAELLMAVCSSDFVARGTISNVTHEVEHQLSQVEVAIHKLYRQKNRIFQQDELLNQWSGPIKTLIQCGVRKGPGDFLFTGNEHFGDAWLGCAPRFKDFLSIYQVAREQKTNPCEFQLD